MIAMLGLYLNLKNYIKTLEDNHKNEEHWLDIWQ